jgi:general secretion pathway protein G
MRLLKSTSPIFIIFCLFLNIKEVSGANFTKSDETRKTMKLLMARIEAYRRDCGFFPPTTEGLGALDPAALARRPDGFPKTKSCSGYNSNGYAQNLLINGAITPDAFGHDFLYRSDQNSYELRSFGADGRPGGSGEGADISSKEISQ